MGAEISWLLDVAVKPGELENFRTLMNEMVEATQGETGALIYEWFVSDDGNRVVLYERYADSAATMEHLASFGRDFAGRFMGSVDPTGFQVFGDASDELRAALEGMGPVHFAPFGGFAR